MDREPARPRCAAPFLCISFGLEDARCAGNTGRHARFCTRNSKECGVTPRLCTTDSRHDLPIAPNRLNQNFAADRPNQVWLADITYVPTSEGWLYLAVVLDLFTRKIVGWAMRDHMRAELTIAALTMAIQRQNPPPCCR